MKGYMFFLFFTKYKYVPNLAYNFNKRPVYFNFAV